MFVGDARLIVEKRNRDEGLFALDRESAAHDLEGNVAAGIGGIVAAAADALQSANHLEAIVIEQNKRANGGASGEKVAPHLVAEDDDVALLYFVKVVEPAPLQQREVANPVVLRFGPRELPAGAGKLADRVHIVGGKNGSDGLDVRGFLADVEIILVREPVLACGVHTARYRRSAAREKHHDVFAVLRKVALVTGSEALPEPDQQEQRTDAPGDAEHGEKRAQFVRPQRGKNLRDNVELHPHGYYLANRRLAMGFQPHHRPLYQDSKRSARGIPQVLELAFEILLSKQVHRFWCNRARGSP